MIEDCFYRNKELENQVVINGSIAMYSNWQKCKMRADWKWWSESRRLIINDWRLLWKEEIVEKSSCDQR